MAATTIYATKDAQVLKSLPSENMGNITVLAIGKADLDGDDVFRTYLFFDLSGIPSLATITEAKLYLYQYGSSGEAESLTFNAYRVIADWLESSITWNNRAAVESSPTITGLTCAYVAGNTWRNWNITALIQEILAGTNYGIMLRAQNESTFNMKQFFSKEQTDSTHKAYLEVIYTPPYPTPTAPTITAPGTVTTSPKTFQWSAASDTSGIFAQNQLYYEMQISFDSGATWGSTYTSTQGSPQYALDIKTLLSLEVLQYYYNTQVKIRVRTKTPVYEGTTYYSSEWASAPVSAAFAVDYRIVPSAPTTLIVDNATPYEGETVVFSIGRPATYNSHDSTGAVNALLYYARLLVGINFTTLISGSGLVTVASKSLSYVVGDLTFGDDLVAEVRSRVIDSNNQTSLYKGDCPFTIKRFRAPALNIIGIERLETSAVISFEISDTGYGGTQISDQINKVEYSLAGAAYADATLGTWVGLTNSFTITGLTAGTTYSLNLRAVNNAPTGTALSNKTGSAYAETILAFVPEFYAFKDSVTGVSGAATKALLVHSDYETPVSDGCAVIENDLDIGGNLSCNDLTVTGAVWTAPTLTNSWANHSSTFNVAGYRKIGDMVSFRGLIKNGTMGQAAFTLPVGYRPARRQLIQTLSTTDGAVMVNSRLDITADGEVIPYTGNNYWFSLDDKAFSIL